MEKRQTDSRTHAQSGGESERKRERKEFLFFRHIFFFVGRIKRCRGLLKTAAAYSFNLKRIKLYRANMGWNCLLIDIVIRDETNGLRWIYSSSNGSSIGSHSFFWSGFFLLLFQCVAFLFLIFCVSQTFIKFFFLSSLSCFHGGIQTNLLCWLWVH